MTNLYEITHKYQTDPSFRVNFDLSDYWNKVLKSDKNRVNNNNFKICLLGYANDLVKPWDPFSIDIGLPGSEECMVYASLELAKRGYSVTVYANPPINSIWSSPYSNPKWYHASYYNDQDNLEKYDLVVMWRIIGPDLGRERGKKVFYWGHDTLFMKGKPLFPMYDGALVLSKSHYNQYLQVVQNFEKIPYVICGNGAVLEQFTKPMNFTNPYSIGYYSNYGRGLNVLLMAWPLIRKEFPTATLDICYGKETWGVISNESLNEIMEAIKKYGDQGVTEHGKIGHLQLASIMQHNSIWAYPCTDIGETFCITAVKCQLSGNIPVTSRIAALNETVHPDAPTIPVITNMDHVKEYLNLLLITMRRIRDLDNNIIMEERLRYIEFAKQFSWKNCIDKWISLYDKINK